MQQTFQHPLPTITEAQIDAAIEEVEYSEVGDACTTMATATLDNGFVVTGFHSFPRAKHFVASEGRGLALADARHKVSYLLQFRAMDHAMNGAQLGEESAPPATPYPRPDEIPAGEAIPFAANAVPPAPVDDTLHIRITDSAGNSHEMSFDPTPDEGPALDVEFNPEVTPADAQPADPAPAAE